MAANYWASTQHLHWQFSKQQLAEMRAELEHEEGPLIQQYPLPDRRLLSIFFRERLSPIDLTSDFNPSSSHMLMSYSWGQRSRSSVDDCSSDSRCRPRHRSTFDGSTARSISAGPTRTWSRRPLCTSPARWRRAHSTFDSSSTKRETPGRVCSGRAETDCPCWGSTGTDLPSCY